MPSFEDTRTQSRFRAEDGFTLIEILVVIMIIGVLTAIALPAFFNQRDKATDAQAKTNLVTAEKAIEAYFTDERSYAAASMTAPNGPTSLRVIEPSLNNAPVPAITAQTKDTYSFEVLSTSSVPVTYVLARDSNGVISRTCSPSASGGCGPSGTW
jgi:type IV pilus assembly protein PilA